MCSHISRSIFVIWTCCLGQVNNTCMQDVSQGSAETCQNVGVSARELACLGSSMAGAVYDTAYSRHGKSSERIRARLRGKNVCACSRRCWKQFTRTSLMIICSLFWGLSKTVQDTLLWSLASARASKRFWGLEGPASQRRKSWKLDDKFVCREAFCKLLGIGTRRLRRVSQTTHGKDERSGQGCRCRRR
jgi:hypothetical protein